MPRCIAPQARGAGWSHVSEEGILGWEKVPSEKQGFCWKRTAKATVPQPGEEVARPRHRPLRAKLAGAGLEVLEGSLVRSFRTPWEGLLHMWRVYVAIRETGQELERESN